MKKYCVSLELAKEMKELGLEQESEFYWISELEYDEPTYKLTLQDKHYLGIYRDEECYDESGVWSAYTVGELGEMLPERISEQELFLMIDKNKNIWSVAYADEHCYRELEKTSISEADARAKMLIYLKKEGII